MQRCLHRLVRAGAPAFVAWTCFVAAPVAAQEHPNDGLVHAGATFELVKRVAGSQRSAIRPNAPESADRARYRRNEARLGLAQLGAQLGPFLDRLRGPRSPYPLLRELILDYAHLRPIDQSDENGRMYIMYIGELYWPFPAPLLADLLRIRIRSPVSQATRDLLTVALRRWGRDNIEPARQDEAKRRQEIADWIDELESPGLFGVHWRREKVVNDLLRARLEQRDIERLRAAAGSTDVSVALAAIKVLGTGGWVRDPTFYVPMLAHPSTEVQRAAFWALVYLPGSGALEHLRSWPGRDEAVAARLREVRPVASKRALYEDVVAFNRLLGAPVPPPPPDLEPLAPPTPVVSAAGDDGADDADASEDEALPDDAATFEDAPTSLPSFPD